MDTKSFTADGNVIISGDNDQVSTVVIQGRQDEYGTDRQVSVVTSAVAGRCEGIILDRCGHAPHIDQRAMVADIVTQFIRQLE